MHRCVELEAFMFIVVEKPFLKTIQKQEMFTDQKDTGEVRNFNGCQYDRISQ